MKWPTLLVLCLTAASASAGDSRNVRLFDEGALGSDYIVAPGTRILPPGYPPAALGRDDNVCVSLAYRILPDGSSHGFAILSNWSSNADAARESSTYLDPYARAAAEAVSRWHFAPKNSDEVKSTAVTIATFAFKGAKNGEDVGQIRDHCKIGRIASFEGQLRRLGAFDRDMNKSNFLGNIEREWRENNRFVFDYPLDHFQR